MRAADGRTTAAALVAGVQRLHAKLRASVDVMGIGLAAPRGDTVAEDKAAAGSANKDMGDVRWVGGRFTEVVEEGVRQCLWY